VVRDRLVGLGNDTMDMVRRRNQRIFVGAKFQGIREVIKRPDPPQ